MRQFIFKMPDLGEGTVEAEIVAWHTQPGDRVDEDQIIVEVMTDKAAVEVPAPVSGRVVSITGGPGDRVAVGAPLIVFDLDMVGTAAPAPSAVAASLATVHAALPAANDGQVPRLNRVKASPANRRRARQAGIDLSTVTGSGPGGRIVAADLAAASAAGASRPLPALRGGAAEPPELDLAPLTTEIKVIGVRRVIAERMSAAKRNIPHFAYVEEVDVTELDALRRHLNGQHPEAPALTYLPLVIKALTRALESFPQCNCVYDATRGVLIRHAAVHVGIATQTPDGLKVPVVRAAQTLGLWELSDAIRLAALRARTNKATREELGGSTITVTSLGKLGGIASTPVINAPEVAIIGLNKAVERPMVHGGAVAVRRMMNISSSFDHRFVDGYDAAALIQALKDLLEHPATIFIPQGKTS